MKKLVAESLNEIYFGLDKDKRFSGRSYSGSYIPDQYKYEAPHEQKRRIAKEKLESNTAYLGSFKTIQDVKKFKPYKYDWILRSADGDGDILIFNGDIASEKDINELKSYFHYAQDVNYFDARPIRYENWLKLPDDLKLASRRNK